MKLLALGLLLGSLLVGSKLPAMAQADTTKFVCYLPLEPMPELVGGDGYWSIAKAIRQRLIYPPEALQAQVEGSVFLTFTVTPSGEVTQVAIVKPLWSYCDSAAVNAVRNLPCFKPRLQKYGAVRYTVPVSFSIAPDQPSARKPHRQLTNKAKSERNSTH